MMTPERVSVAYVQEQLKEYYDFKIQEDPEAVEFDVNKITQELVNEMNEDITGGNIKEGSASSYVPRSIWQVLADEDIVDEDEEDDFVEWFEQNNS